MPGFLDVLLVVFLDVCLDVFLNVFDRMRAYNKISSKIQKQENPGIHEQQRMYETRGWSIPSRHPGRTATAYVLEVLDTLILIRYTTHTRSCTTRDGLLSHRKLRVLN